MILFLSAFWFARYGIDRRTKDGKTHHWEENDDAKFVSRTGMYFISLAYLQCIVLGTGTFIYLKRIAPFKRDADAGVKQKVPYEIVRKEYFELVNEYYFALSDPAHLHHRVDEETYRSYNEGDTLYLYRAPSSRHFFDQSGRFSLF